MNDRQTPTRAGLAICRALVAVLATALLMPQAAAQLRMPGGGDSGLRLPGASQQQDAGTGPAAGTGSAAGQWGADRAGPQARTPAPGVIRELDRVVAVVNNDVITLRELERRADLAAVQIRRRAAEVPPRDVLLRQLLEQMIIDRAQQQLAREHGIRVDDAMLDRAVASIAQENRLTLAELRQRVEQDGQSFASFRDDIRGEILRTRIREREVDAKVQISEADIDAFLAAQGAQADTATEYQVAHILLRVPESASTEQIERQRVRGEELLRQLDDGESFARLAAAFSDAPDALDGGALGWRTAERLPELFLKALEPLAAGQRSELLRSPAGFHILRLIDRRAGSRAQLQGEPVTQTHARHILIRPSEMVSEDEAFRRLREIRERIEAGTADFAEMARQYSADGSAGRGGDLGWVYPGDTVPEFERAMNGLPPGAVSEPVRTPFGVHLIEVIARRTDEASPERLRQRAREVLRAQRIDERYEDWVRQLRDSTYVEYKLDGN